MTAPEPADRHRITLLLDQAREGDSKATEQVWREMYTEIHRIARGFADREGATPTIQASMLISEAYLRLFGGVIPEWNDRKHFLNTVAKSMGRFLIDHARSRDAQKRGGGKKPLRLTISAGELSDYRAAHASSAGDALESLDMLEAESPDAAEIARLRFVLGLSVDQAAEVTGLAPRTVKAKWAYAKAWLRERLEAVDPSV
jgi:RNA polymerase sigma factor (TIGR02999 family)